MIARLSVTDDGWTGIWRTGFGTYKPGDVVLVNCGGRTTLAVVRQVARTRAGVGSYYKGPLKKIIRKATNPERRAYGRVRDAQKGVIEAKNRLNEANAFLREVTRP